MAFPKIPYDDYYVYVLFRDTGHPFYIGLGRGNRWEQHERHKGCGGNRHKAAVIKSVLSIRTEVPKIKIAEGLLLSQALEIERAFIAAIGRAIHGGPLTNLTDGGEGSGGHVLSPEARQRQSERMIGKPHPAILGIPRSQGIRDAISKSLSGRKLGPYSAERIAKAADGQRGKKRGPASQEHKVKLAIAIKAHWSTPEGRKMRSCQNIGRKHSPETLEKMRLSALARVDDELKERFKRVIQGNVGRKASEETRAKMRASQKGRTHSEETLSKMRAAHKRRAARQAAIRASQKELLNG